MKIYTVISYSYDYYEYENWIMTTTKLDKVNEFLEEIAEEDRQVSKFLKNRGIFFINTNSDFIPDIKEERHIRIYVTEE